MQPSRSTQKQQGQISVMVGIMLMTFLFLFAFVINTGMLVNAKINLQNAADLAAYAGAAVQARQLTEVSYLNYEMRRQWKKFLFRLYVLGNMAMDGFPRGSGQTGPMQYIPNNNDPSNRYSVPATCVIFNPTDNFCHLTKLPQISIPPPTFLDSINDTLRQQLTAIEQIRANNCKGIGQTNLMLNIYWLFNTDPTLSGLTNSDLDQTQRNTMTIVQGLANGMGIVPREIILRFRIRTLNDYVNATAGMGLTKSTVDGYSQQIDPSYYERTIEAFNSAYETLGTNTFDGSTITMDELTPSGSSGSNLLQLKDITQKFDTFALDLNINGQNTSYSSNATGDCTATIIPIVVNRELPVGVYKDPTVLTYYAVRLKAQAKILFSPFGPIQMKAYAAAQPFGSRIGPSGAQFAAPNDAPVSNLTNSANNDLTNLIPNLPVQLKDTANWGQGWDTYEVLGTMYGQLLGADRSIQSVINSNSLNNGYAAAMAPNPWEGSIYNIINDMGENSLVRNFDTTQTAAFWAPVISPMKAQQASQEIQNEITSFFNGVTVPSQHLSASGSGDSMAAIQSTFTTGLTNYITNVLPSGQGENGESLNIVRISDPFHLPGNGSQAQLISNPPTIFMTDSTLFKTSWNMPYNATLRSEGRVGYSVKFVSFDSLTAHKLSTNGASTWENSPNEDSEATQDIPFIQH